MEYFVPSNTALNFLILFYISLIAYIKGSVRAVLFFFFKTENLESPF